MIANCNCQACQAGREIIDQLNAVIATQQEEITRLEERVVKLECSLGSWYNEYDY